MYRLILASESPRRRELLTKAGIRHQAFPVKVSEFPDKTLNVDEQILDIAGRKARAAFSLLRQSENHPFIVLAADTEVILDGGPLGKPSTHEDAVRTLQRLSGRWHEVKTAFWLIDSVSSETISHLETTRIRFRDLSATEIRSYVLTEEPMDKAGSYGIQGQGRALVDEIQGSFDNVVGLPVDQVIARLREKNWVIT